MPIRRPDHGCHGYSSSQNSVPWAFSSLAVQHDQAACLTWIQATSTGGVRPCLRRVAGRATPTASAGHTGATADVKLAFHLDHSARADYSTQTTSGWNGPATMAQLVARLSQPHWCASSADDLFARA